MVNQVGKTLKVEVVSTFRWDSTSKVAWAAPKVLPAPCTAFLDLHGLHVKEACSLVSSIIKQYQEQAASGSHRGGKLVVCAGAGKHSDRALSARQVAASDGAGRLTAAVERLLCRSGLTVKQLQSGLFEIS